MEQQVKKEMLVSVCMTAYNHKDYISKAIDSVLEQVCDFDVEIVVGVDFCQDGTQEIVRSYSDKHPHKFAIKLFYQRVGMRLNYADALKRCRGRYIALCDGDDWWCDTHKLQRQVEYLEQNPQVAMCFTRSERRSEDGTSVLYPPVESPDCSFEGMLRLNSAENCTVVARREVVEEYYRTVKPLEHSEWLTDDLPMWLWFAAHHRIAFLDGVTAVHRIVEGSVSHSHDYRGRIAFCDSLGDIKLWADREFNEGRHQGELLRQRENDALWALARYGSCKEYWCRWWSGVAKYPSLLLNAAGYGLIFKRLKRK